MIIVICLLMERKSLNLEIKMLIFQLNFVLEVFLMDLVLLSLESREVSLNGNVYGFSVDCNSIDRSDIQNIHKYLMTKNNIK